MLVPEGVQEAITALERAREPYAVATVVWTRGLGSGKAGDRAVVTGDGRLRGWIGGACALDSVIRECKAALREGSARVLCIGTLDDFPKSEGRVLEEVSCASEGSYEVFIEPRLPQPQLVVLGDAPVAVTLGRLARTVGFRVLAITRGSVERPEAHEHLVVGDELPTSLGAESFVVVATLGEWDDEAIRAALGTDAQYIALVASARRWAKMRPLVAKRYGESAAARIKAPAGLDLGPLPHQEIAVALLGEVVQAKARHRQSQPVVSAPAVASPVAGRASAETAVESNESPGRSCCGSKNSGIEEGHDNGS
ncbi:MAG: XdhC family protein [Myxococcota bacterium]